MTQCRQLKIAIIGSGLSGLSCAWLLSQRHQVCIFEKNHYSGAISPVFSDRPQALDASLMTCSRRFSPNLLALAKHLSLDLHDQHLSSGQYFANLTLAPKYNDVCLNSIDDFKIKLKYRRQFKRFLESLSQAEISTNHDQNLAQWSKACGFSIDFMRQCIWPLTSILGNFSFAQALLLPRQSLVNALLNLGLVNSGGVHFAANNSLVPALLSSLNDASLQTNRAVRQLRRLGGKVFLQDHLGDNWQFDHVIFCCNSAQALRLLSDPRPSEIELLSSVKLQRQHVVLHVKTAASSKSRVAYANFSADALQQTTSLEYCLNYHAKLGVQSPIMLTLNPPYRIHSDNVITSYVFDQVIYAADSHTYQAHLWRLQGENNTWFGGAWTGLGFNEDAVSAGISIAEALSGCTRPWEQKTLPDRLLLPADWRQRHQHLALAA